MLVVLVLVAHNGRTLQLGSVHPGTRVDAVQEVLEELAGIPVGEQIVMCRGIRLDPNKTLSAYQLLAEDQTSAEENPVFLYSKAFIRPGTPIEANESFQEIEVKVPQMGAISVEHPLHRADSPLVRALPDYELQFQHQLLLAREHWDVSQKYVHRCQQLLSEQEVQSRAIDAARANVQGHFNHISQTFAEFMSQYQKQHSRHSGVLETIQADVDRLANTELHPGLRTENWRRLCDLVPQQQLREWASGCSRAHARFASKVADLESLFTALKSEVESMFMQAPTVDLDDLGAMLEEKEQLLDEEDSIVQALSKDVRTVCELVEDTVRQLGTERLTSATIRDACGAMDNMNESHLQRLVPRLKECSTGLGSFCQHCTNCKNRMTRDVLRQLQAISAQQSRIVEMKNKLAAFKEVDAKQEEAFAELMVVRRIPAAYKACLAECVRRRAWSEMYTSQVAKLEEHMSKVTSEEVQKRDMFQRCVEGYWPADLLVKMGLIAQTPHCQISVPEADISLLDVSVDDLCDSHKTGISATQSGASNAEGCLPGMPDLGLPETPEVSCSELQDTLSDNGDHLHKLEMENAKLREAYASIIANQKLKEVGEQSRSQVGIQVDRLEGEGREQTVVKLKEALEARELVNNKLENDLEAVRTQNSEYKERIKHLEAQLTDAAGLQPIVKRDTHTPVHLHLVVTADSRHPEIPQEQMHTSSQKSGDALPYLNSGCACHQVLDQPKSAGSPLPDAQCRRGSQASTPKPIQSAEHREAGLAQMGDHPAGEVSQSGQLRSGADSSLNISQNPPATTSTSSSPLDSSQVVPSTGMSESESARAKRSGSAQQTDASMCSSEGVSEFLSLSSEDVSELANDTTPVDTVLCRGPETTVVVSQGEPGEGSGRKAT